MLISDTYAMARSAFLHSLLSAVGGESPKLVFVVASLSRKADLVLEGVARDLGSLGVDFRLSVNHRKLMFANGSEVRFYSYDSARSLQNLRGYKADVIVYDGEAYGHTYNFLVSRVKDSDAQNVYCINLGDVI